MAKKYAFGELVLSNILCKILALINADLEGEKIQQNTARDGNGSKMNWY